MLPPHHHHVTHTQAWGLSLAAVILLPGFVAMEPSSDMFALRARIREHLQQSEALHAGLVKLVLACGSAAVLSRVLQPLLPSVLSIAAAAAVAGAGMCGCVCLFEGEMERICSV